MAVASDPKIMAREIFLAYADLARYGDKARHVIDGINAGDMDDMPMLQIAALAIETERKRAAGTVDPLAAFMREAGLE
jgi:hypothetical protein